MTFKRTAGYLAWVVVMAFFFANVEIQIEGAAGWAANLPTWRIEKHWLLDIVWGGRPMTGYHAWVFSFMALVFFAPLAFQGRWTRRDAGLAFAGFMVFWITEDFLWFVLNPSYGWGKFDAVHATWHPLWVLDIPVDYWPGLVGASLIFTLLRRLPARWAAQRRPMRSSQHSRSGLRRQAPPAPQRQHVFQPQRLQRRLGPHG